MQACEQATIDDYAKQVLELAIEGIQRRGWWGAERGKRSLGSLCELQAVHEGARIVYENIFRSNYSDAGIITQILNRVLGLVYEANDISHHMTIPYHNDHDLTSGEDAILEFKKAIHLLEAQESQGA